jgi:DNA-damage-inducible protein D
MFEHFPGVRKLIIVARTPSEIADIKLTRCYLTALNGDPRKEEIAFARLLCNTNKKMEFIEQRMAELKRISVRETITYEKVCRACF